MNLMTLRNFFTGLFLLVAPVLPAQQAPETNNVYLSGTGVDDAKEWDFMCSDGRKAGQWSKLPVPSNWELHGFGTYNYGRDKNPAREVGYYKHTFKVPAEAKGQKVTLVFEGSMTDTEVKINGRPAGEIHSGAFYRFTYDISKLIKYGEENLLEVKVAKHSADAGVNTAEREADYWIFGGIFRPVYLEITPKVHIERVACAAEQSGEFRAEVFHASGLKNFTVKAELTDLTGKGIGKAIEQKVDAKSGKTVLSHTFAGITPWNQEQPFLYKVKFTLISPTGAVHSMSTRIGFRTVEVRERDGIYLNNVKIMFKGANRHTFHPDHGRASCKKFSIEDVKLMQSMNMNAVRMSHYPPDQHFLDVCDSIGLLVLDELAGWQTSYGTETGKKLVREMVIRDVNHPSVVLWDNGNEGGWNTDLDNEFEKYDPQKRKVIHPWGTFNSMNTAHYKPYNCCPGYLFDGHDIFFPTEFLHGLFDGGHGAGLKDYWTAMEQNPLSAGGFLWALIDEGVKRTDRNDSIDVSKDQAPDGIVGPYHEKEGSYYTIKKIWSPVEINLPYIGPAFSGLLPVKNKYFFNNLNQCRFSWKAARLSPTEGEKTINTGSLKSPDVAPGQTGHLQLPAGFRSGDADVVYVTAVDPAGNPLYTWSWMLKTQAEYGKQLSLPTGTGKPSVTETAGDIVVTAAGMKYNFSKSSGEITAITDTEGNKISSLTGPFLVADEVADTGAVAAKVEIKGDSAVITFTKSNPESPEFIWTFTAGGAAKLSYSYTMEGYFNYFGISFDYKEEDVDSLSWIGRGPYRVWKNRRDGVEFGRWNLAYNDTRTGAEWNYPEFKGFRPDWYVADWKTKERNFRMINLSEHTYLRVLSAKNAMGWGSMEIHNPKGQISILHAIPAIGTKFHPSERLGPHGQKNIATKIAGKFNRYSGEVIFVFDQENTKQ